MKKNMLGVALTSVSLVTFTECDRTISFDVDKNLQYCAVQAGKTLKLIPGDTLMPRNVDQGTDRWRFVKADDWTSGFWPGALWYVYEATGEEKWKTKADKFTKLLTPLSEQPAYDHDLGFQIFNSFGNGYRLTHNETYKQVVLRTADTLATLFNPKVGTILSWPRMVQQMNWPHNTIIDNMINLELLFWASRNGGGKHLYDIAVKHAETTMKNHFRDDFTSYHVVVYDTVTGHKIKGITHQGFADDSMWARGQAWAIYGFTVVYRETGRREFLDFARNVAEVYIRHLPEDLVPYWDFNDTGIPNAPRDASAAAITASALLELSQFADDAGAQRYQQLAGQMLEALSDQYQSRETNTAFLLHSTGHKPNGSEVDASIIYADYYYLEALLRLKKIRAGEALKRSASR